MKVPVPLMHYVLYQNNRFLALSLCIGVAVLAGCVTPTLYQPMESYGFIIERGMEGYEDIQVDKNTYRVNFQGNSATNKERVERYAIYRCAELTMEKGYDYFVVISESSATEVSSSSSSGYVSKRSYVDVSSSFSVQKTIKLYKGVKPDDALHAYTASEVLANFADFIERPD